MHPALTARQFLRVRRPDLRSVPDQPEEEDIYAPLEGDTPYAAPVEPPAPRPTHILKFNALFNEVTTIQEAIFSLMDLVDLLVKLKTQDYEIRETGDGYIKFREPSEPTAQATLKIEYAGRHRLKS